MFKVVVLAAFFSVAAAQYYHGHGYEDHHADYYAHPQYEFKYGVDDHHTGDHKSQHEIRDGDVTKGEYSLVEPDGTLRKVEYSVDKDSGFNAVVTRTGHAAHPTGHVTHHAVPIAHSLHHSIPVVHQGVHHSPVLPFHHVDPVHHVAPAYSQGHASSFSNAVSHHEPAHHGYYY